MHSSIVAGDGFYLHYTGTQKPLLALPPAKDHLAPSVEVAKAMQAAFDYFNEELFRPVFGHPLPRVLLNMSRRRGAVAFFQAGQWKDEYDKTFDEIALVPEHTNRTPSEVMSTLVHEMAHLKDHEDGTHCKGGYHGRSWTKIMARLGLPEAPQKTRGGKLSRLKVSHTVAEDGPFAKAFANLPHWIKLPFISAGPRFRVAADGPVNLQGKRARYECPGCAGEKGNRAPILRGPAGMKIRCQDHDEDFIETGF